MVACGERLPEKFYTKNDVCVEKMKAKKFFFIKEEVSSCEEGLWKKSAR